jgi:predicted TIM-barrel fold metal-dependent hydrolase
MRVLAKHLKKQANQTPWVFADDPIDTLREHVWVTPYLEEDLGALAELIGADRILFGSDWPHGEGVALPLDFEKELGGFDEADTTRIMRDNARELLGSGAA